MFRILVSDKLGKAGLQCLDQAEDAVYDLLTGLEKEDLLALIPEYDALIVRSGTQVDADVLRAGSKLKVSRPCRHGCGQYRHSRRDSERHHCHEYARRQQHGHRRTHDGPDARRQPPHTGSLRLA